MRRLCFLTAASVSLLMAGLLSPGTAGAAQACTITGPGGPDRLVGTSGDDVICGLGGDDVIDGRGGNDVIRGGAGKDRISGNAGADTIWGGPGSDTIRGGEASDGAAAAGGGGRTPPDTTVSGGPPAETEATNATLFLWVSENPATFQCSPDGAPFAPCTQVVSYTGLALGRHTFRARATDRLGTPTRPRRPADGRCSRRERCGQTLRETRSPGLPTSPRSPSPTTALGGSPSPPASLAASSCL
ncbi:MAG: hypothetical protein OXG37_04630 [Actinomycetia bacterium]|nr:hypothetical protein [Actinomycetes bacterium]